jgi:hypothetical protein
MTARPPLVAAGNRLQASIDRALNSPGFQGGWLV